MNRTLILLGLLSACLFVLPAAAAAQDPASPAMFSGELRDHIRVGAAVANGQIALFFCGDERNVATKTHWLVADFALDGVARGFGTNDGWAFIVVYDHASDRVGGWVWGPIAGKWMPWAVGRSAAGEGLYRAKDDQFVEGVIVTDLDHNGVFELQGAVKNLVGTPHFDQIVPIASVEPKDGALEVAVPVGGGVLSNVIVHQVTTIDFH